MWLYLYSRGEQAMNRLKAVLKGLSDSQPM